MQAAVNNLEAMFQKAETDLNYLSRKLQVENGQSQEKNPIKLMTLVGEVKAEYSALVKDMAAIQAAQKDAMDSLQSGLQSMTQALGRLESQCQLGSELGESTEAVFEELSEFLGVPFINCQPSVSCQSDNNSLSTQNEGSLAQGSRSGAAAGSKSGGDAADHQLSAQEKRAHRSDFTEVTPEEFKSVSSLVRGKVKLEDLNKTYKLLWEHFKTGGNKTAMTSSEMNSMGLRVSGATGEAKLKILRSLKLCQISRNGEVKLS